MKNTFHRLKETFKNRDFNVSVQQDETTLSIEIEQIEPGHILSGVYIQRALQVVPETYLFYVRQRGGKYSIIFHKKI
jgi:hypothetical protein